MIIARQNIHFLEQGLDLLAAVGDGQYSDKGLFGQASAGAHLRHVIDAYRCFLVGIEPGLVDYDARERDRRIETDRDVAAGAIAQVIDRLAGLPEPSLDQDLRIQVDTAAWEQGKDLWTRSTVARELQFLLSHTVHHYALIALILRGHGYDPGADFGVAPSTLEYRKAETRSASAG